MYLFVHKAINVLSTTQQQSWKNLNVLQKFIVENNYLSNSFMFPQDLTFNSYICW